MTAPVRPLEPNQLRAVAPAATVWLSASAGTGKTHVLSSRVLRLLLQPGVTPSQILCLTFTKAGAAEMAARINDRLAGWVRADRPRLIGELRAIGADYSLASVERARTLFAAVLDCPGGGLRIDTIHAFSQWLLGAFPREAQLAPGTRAMEDGDRLALVRRVLADLLVAAERAPEGGRQLLAAVADLSLRHGAAGVEDYLQRCAAARAAWFGPGAWQPPMRPRVNQMLGLAAEADAASLAAACADDAFDVAALRRCGEVLAAWPTSTGEQAAATIAEWLASAPAARAAGIGALRDVLFARKPPCGAKNVKSLAKLDANYATFADRVAADIDRVREMAALLALAGRLEPALELGRAFALAWDQAKAREGLIDFDDQVRLASDLLTRSAYAAWISYKLDRRFDHILVDEAQDTNAAQWRIIDALTHEFFAGAGQHGDVARTLFVVGDYKQAIFGFQGTSPENFELARGRVAERMRGAAANARAVRGATRAEELREYELDRSFRSAQRVLDFVDGTIDALGHESLGLPRPAEPHRGEDRWGHVALWRPIGGRGDDGAIADMDDAAPGDDPEGGDPEGGEGQGDEGEGDGGDGDEGQGGETWLSRADRRMADAIARQVRDWLERGFALAKGTARQAGPGDIMVLVRRRAELAALIVARLHAAGVPVAGVDRLRLAGPLAVRDLIAALRFAAQPLDCLNLACLLTSPLIGWSQDQLLAYGYREPGLRLWDHLRQSREPSVVETLAMLRQLLARADFDPPQILLHWLLVGPWQGRRRLVARLGREADDPIDELLSQAAAYAAAAVPSLAGFITAFEAGEVEIKREAGASELVRVMTVHAAKGLQAPIVILADAAGSPADSRNRGFDMPDAQDPARLLPLPPLRRDACVGRVATRRERLERTAREEHWRLFYVAITRAEEALFVGGALSRREKEPHPDSWFARARRLFGADEWVADPIWGARLDWGDPPAALPQPAAAPARTARSAGLPAWLEQAPGAEPRPPRPLAPSALGDEEAADAPYPPGDRGDAARRGTIMHRLLERLPAVPEADRAGLGERWLERNAGDLDQSVRAGLLAGATGVIADPRWADLFGPAALVEVPIAALVGSRVVSGTIDRLLVGVDRVRLVDFKTARRPPAGAADVPAAVLRQMAAYALALESTYPGRAIEVALLYTAAPRLIALEPAVLAPYKQALLAAE